MLKARRIVAAIAAAVFLAALGTHAAWTAETRPSTRNAATTEKLNFLIYDPTNTKLVGRGHYTVTVSDDSITIAGRNDYLDHSYDVEHERLIPHGNEPRLVSYKHLFFNKDQAPQITALADPTTGKASCTTFHGAQRDVRSKTLTFPSDTYAGSSVLVPISDQLKHNPSAADIHFHAFDCAPGPRIFEMTVNMRQALWRHLPHYDDLLKADARPVFGWFDIFLKPFVPVTQFWFDPRIAFGFMGGTMSRYYGGPEIMLVRIPSTLSVPPLAATAPPHPPIPDRPADPRPLASLPLTPPDAAAPTFMTHPATPSLAEAKPRTPTGGLPAGDAAHPTVTASPYAAPSAQ